MGCQCARAPPIPYDCRPQTALKGRTATAASGRYGRLLAEGRDQVPDPLRLLRALADPVFDTRQVKLELRLALARNRVEKSNLFKTRAALALAAVGDDNVIKGLIPRATARQTNRYHQDLRGPSGPVAKRARILRNEALIIYLFSMGPGEAWRGATLERLEH